MTNCFYALPSPTDTTCSFQTGYQCPARVGGNPDGAALPLLSYVSAPSFPRKREPTGRRESCKSLLCGGAQGHPCAPLRGAISLASLAYLPS